MEDEEEENRVELKKDLILLVLLSLLLLLLVTLSLLLLLLVMLFLTGKQQQAWTDRQRVGDVEASVLSLQIVVAILPIRLAALFWLPKLSTGWKLL